MPDTLLPAIDYPKLFREGDGTVKPFMLKEPFSPAGDQPAAIAALVQGITEGKRDQVLLGVTGSGKTYTMAQVIQRTGKPALVMAPNKTLAAQLYAEMKSFFPENAVEYFVSYYDYYQPEAYIARSDTYIEKTSSINDQIDRMRHSATRALLERRDVIIVASVSCIYGLGGPESYSQMICKISRGESPGIREVTAKLVELQYKRNDFQMTRGTFRIKGDILEIHPTHLADRSWRISFFGDEVESIHETDALTGERFAELEHVIVFANSHYITPGPTMRQAMEQIKGDLHLRLNEFESMGKLLEAQRLDQRTKFDLEMMAATGSCAGIENYSRYLCAQQPGEPPPTLFQYLPKDALLFVDESHVGVPQIGGMYNGDRARKSVLSEHGFRLPSCMDNRPLKFEEWDAMRPQTIFVSATPCAWELERAGGIFTEQVIRPTGLVDPVCTVRPCEGQIDDLIAQCRDTAAKGYRVLVTTLTKKTAEALTQYMEEAGIRVRYMHSDIETLERIEIIRGLRLGEFDVLIGINLLREGLDIPECALVAILDADKEGFLRSKTSLIQTIGRAARNVDGRVILYADRMTGSMTEALAETQRRRDKQLEYNTLHGITAMTIRREIQAADAAFASTAQTQTPEKKAASASLTLEQFEKRRTQLLKQMKEAAANLEFEAAARLRDEIRELEQSVLFE